MQFCRLRGVDCLVFGSRCSVPRRLKSKANEASSFHFSTLSIDFKKLFYHFYPTPFLACVSRLLAHDG